MVYRIEIGIDAMKNLKKNQGFVLVETIVVVVFIAGIFTFLFANVLPLIGDYERVADYDLIEDKYAAHMIRKMILKDEECRVRNLLTLNGADYYRFENDEICYYLENVNYCKALLSPDYLNVKEIVLTTYSMHSLKNDTALFSRSLSEYIKFLPEYDKKTNIVNSYHYQRRLIVVFQDGSMSNIELLKNMDLNVVCTTGGC